MEYLSVKKRILGARMSATVSACLSLEKYFCSFSNKISYIISESIPVPYFEDEEKLCFWRGVNDIFAFQNIAIIRRETSRKEIWPIVSAVLQLHYVTGIKPHSIKTVYCGLRTADCGLQTVDNGYRSTPPWKKSSAYSNFSKIFKVCISLKRKCLHLVLCPWHHLALRLGLRSWGTGGESPLKVTGMFVAFLKRRSRTFWVFNIFNHRGIAYGRAWYSLI